MARENTGSRGPGIRVFLINAEISKYFIQLRRSFLRKIILQQPLQRIPGAYADPLCKTFLVRGRKQTGPKGKYFNCFSCFPVQKRQISAMDAQDKPG